MHERKEGFTLVELAIVLVIIGLLIGGILIAQSMIGTAKIQSQVRQLQQFDVAVSNFKTKYNGWPANAPEFGGNGNGCIEIFPNDYEWQQDIYNFWNNLSTTESINNGVVYPLNYSPTVGINLPAAKLGGQNSGVIVDCPMAGRQIFVGTNIYWITGMVPNSGGHLYPNSLYNILSAQEALAVDAKMDDGIANSGNVQAASAASPGIAGDNTAGSGCVMNTDPATYNVDSTSATPCSLAILMLSQVGESQQ